MAALLFSIVILFVICQSPRLVLNIYEAYQVIKTQFLFRTDIKNLCTNENLDQESCKSTRAEHDANTSTRHSVDTDQPWITWRLNCSHQYQSILSICLLGLCLAWEDKIVGNYWFSLLIFFLFQQI